jgi:beclin 1
VETQDPALRYPYLVQNDKVNSLSGMHTNNEEKWAKAMKYLLTDFKWAVAWVAKHHGEQLSKHKL